MPSGSTSLSAPKSSLRKSWASQSVPARPVGSAAGAPVAGSEGRAVRRSRQSGLRYSQARSASSRTGTEAGRP